MSKLPKQSLTELVDTKLVYLVLASPYVHLYKIENYLGEPYFEIISLSTFEVGYRTQSRFFAIRRFQELSQD